MNIELTEEEVKHLRGVARNRISLNKDWLKSYLPHYDNPKNRARGKKIEQVIVVWQSILDKATQKKDTPQCG